MKHLHLSIIFLSLALAACGSSVSTIPGTRIVDNQTNRDIIKVCEEYRVAVERKDTAALRLMASEHYFEDGGTVTGGDDYGYDGLRQVLEQKFSDAQDIRYSLRYVKIRRQCKAGGDPETNEGCRALVEVLIDASYSFTDARGQERRSDKRDQGRLVLEWSGEKWLFTEGM